MTDDRHVFEPFFGFLLVIRAEHGIALYSDLRRHPDASAQIRSCLLYTSITALGVTDFSNTYAYTVQAASDASGMVKGVSFQCCPAALSYRRSIAKDVLGTDDPAEVQELLNSWDKFNAVAADAKSCLLYTSSSRPRHTASKTIACVNIQSESVRRKVSCRAASSSAGLCG